MRGRNDREQEHRATLPTGCSRGWDAVCGAGQAGEGSVRAAPYLAVHQQPDGEGDVQAAFGHLGLHFLPGDGRRALAGRAAPAQAAPRPDHLGTQRGTFALRTGSLGWDRPYRAARHGQKAALEQGIA